MRTSVRRTPNRHVRTPSPSLTPRSDRRRAEEATTRHRSALFGGPVLGALLAGGVILSVSGSAPAAPVTSVNESVAGLATWHHTPGIGSQDSRGVRRAATPIEDLGTVTGTYTLLGPGAVPAGASVAFVLSGPARVVRFDSSAPYEVEIDTTKIPDGVYRLTVSVLSFRASSPARYDLTVANTPTPAPTATDPAPTSTEPSEPAPSQTATQAPVPTTSPTQSVPATPTTAPTATAPTATAPATTPPPTVPPGTTPPPTTQPTTAPPATVPPTSAPSSGPVADVLSQTNAQRAANGCAALTIDTRLASAAQAHSADMAANNYFAHNSQDGRSPFDRMTAAGYRFSTAGENIAMGYRTASDVMTGWMNSAGHRANILNCSYTNIGIGYAVNASGAPYWTQDFGRPA